MNIYLVNRSNTENAGDYFLGHGFNSTLKGLGVNVRCYDYLGLNANWIGKLISKILGKKIVLTLSMILPYINSIKFKPKVIVIGGGQLLLDNKYFPTALGSWILLGKIIKARVVLHSVGVEVINGKKISKQLRRNILRVDYISVRDRVSKNIIDDSTGLNVDMAPDSAYGIEICQSTKKGNRIGVCICAAESYLKYNTDKDFESLISDVVGMIGCALKSGETVAIFSTVKSDYKFEKIWVDEIEKRLQIKLCIDKWENFNELLKIISRYDLVIGARMHSLIIAQLHGVDTMAIIRNRKIGAYVDGFFQLGVEEQRRLFVQSVKKNIVG